MTSHCWSAAIPRIHTRALPALRQELLDNYESPNWKSFITKTSDPVQNLWLIFDENYYSVSETVAAKYGKKSSTIVGGSNSETWDTIRSEAIKSLLNPDNMHEDYRDTDNGCEAIALQALWTVISEVAARS